MNKQFNKCNLRTGDITVSRNDELGVVILEKNIILYQHSGYDELDMFNEDLTSFDGDKKFDIMQVYRGYGNSPICFYSYKDEELVYCREATDIKPIMHKEETSYEEPVITNNKDLITVVMQAMYGNQTYMQLRDEDMDYYILGILDKSFVNESDRFDRTIIRIPNSNCVLVYNKYQEEEELKRKQELLEKKSYNLKPLAVIPELDVTLYSRCLICRIDDNGKLISIEEDDNELVIKYLSL